MNMSYAGMLSAQRLRLRYYEIVQVVRRGYYHCAMSKALLIVYAHSAIINTWKLQQDRGKKFLLRLGGRSILISLS